MFSVPATAIIVHNLALYGGQEVLSSLTGVSSTAYSAVRTYLNITQKTHCDPVGENHDPQSKLRNAVLLKASTSSENYSPEQSTPYVNEKFLHMYFCNASLQFINSACLSEARGKAVCKMIMELRREGKRCEYALPLLEKIFKDGRVPGDYLAMALHWNTSQSFNEAISNLYEREIALLILLSGNKINDDGQLHSLLINIIEAGDGEMVRCYLNAITNWRPFGFSLLIKAAEKEGNDEIITMLKSHPHAPVTKPEEGCVIS